MSIFNEEQIRQAIEAYQKAHPLCYAIDITKVDKDRMDDLIFCVTNEIDRIAELAQQDSEIHIICEMAKQYMNGVRPSYEIRPKAKWERMGHIADRIWFKCSECGRSIYVTFGEEDKYPFCHCGADMRKKDNNAPTVKSPCNDCIELECEHHGVVCPHYRR